MSALRSYRKLVELSKPIAEFRSSEAGKPIADFTVQHEYLNAEFRVQNLK